MSNDETKTQPKLSTVVDYNKEYKEYKRCKNCNRKTKGIEDFQNIRTKKITKTCIKCRTSVYKSIKNNPRKIIKPLTNKEKLSFYETLMSSLGDEFIKKYTEDQKLTDKRYKDLLNTKRKEKNIKDIEDRLRRILKSSVSKNANQTNTPENSTETSNNIINEDMSNLEDKLKEISKEQTEKNNNPENSTETRETTNNEDINEPFSLLPKLSTESR